MGWKERFTFSAIGKEENQPHFPKRKNEMGFDLKKYII